MTYEVWLPILAFFGKPARYSLRSGCMSGTGKCIRCGGGVGVSA